MEPCGFIWVEICTTFNWCLENHRKHHQGREGHQIITEAAPEEHRKYSAEKGKQDNLILCHGVYMPGFHPQGQMRAWGVGVGPGKRPVA